MPVIAAAASSAIKSPDPPMDDLRLGVIMGLALAFRHLLSNLPANKPAFIFNFFALNYMMGGYTEGKVRMVSAFATNVFCRSFEIVMEMAWNRYKERFWEIVSETTKKLFVERAPPVRNTPAKGCLGANAGGNVWILPTTPLRSTWNAMSCYSRASSPVVTSSKSQMMFLRLRPM